MLEALGPAIVHVPDPVLTTGDVIVPVGTAYGIERVIGTGERQRTGSQADGAGID